VIWTTPVSMTDVAAASTPAPTDKTVSAFGHRREIPMAT